jgi:hypothetical protein
VLRQSPVEMADEVNNGRAAMSGDANARKHLLAVCQQERRQNTSIGDHELLTVKPAAAGDEVAGTRGTFRLLAEPRRSIDASAEALADQSLDARYLNVIGLGADHL